MTDDEIEHMQCLSLSYPAHDKNALRQRTAKDNKSKANNLHGASFSDGLDTAHKNCVSLCIKGEHKGAEKLFRTVLEGRKEAFGTTQFPSITFPAM